MLKSATQTARPLNSSTGPSGLVVNEAAETTETAQDEPTSPSHGDSSCATGGLTNQQSGQVGKASINAKNRKKKKKSSFFDRVEAFISRLSTRNNFWHRVCSLIWLPYAFRSGIRMKMLSKDTFTAVLPFKRFNRNWYNAMAGAALLANSEIAGGMYIFGICGGDYTVVCKRLEYRFLRPCFGPAVYKINPREAIEELIASGGEFNATVDIDISQQLTRPGEREKRVGKCEATFHITPKQHHKQRRQRKSGAPAVAASATATDLPNESQA